MHIKIVHGIIIPDRNHIRSITKSLFTAGLCIHQAGLLTRIIAIPAFPTFVSGISGEAPHYSDGIVPESHRNSLLACLIKK